MAEKQQSQRVRIPKDLLERVHTYLSTPENDGSPHFMTRQKDSTAVSYLIQLFFTKLEDAKEKDDLIEELRRDVRARVRLDTKYEQIKDWHAEVKRIHATMTKQERR